MKNETITGFVCLILLLSFLAKSVFAVPKVTIQTAPQQVYKNEELSVTFDITNDALSSDSYYVKGRIGSTSASLNQGETFNPLLNSWFSDTSGWSNFPTIAFSSSMIATGTVTLRTKSTATTGNNLIVVRVNRNSVSYDSSSNTMLVLDPLPTPTATLTPTPTTSPTPTPSLTSTSAPITTPSATPTTISVSYQNIYISEAMVNPSPGESEWVELFNDNNFTVTLTQWFIDDVENTGSSPKIFSLEIPAKTYGIIDMSSSIFNNTGDSVRLLDFNKNRVDDFEYASTSQGKTMGRISIDSDEFCIQEPSKGIVNSSCINPTVTPNPTSKPTNKPTNSPYPSVTAVANRLINRSPSISINRYINTNNNLTPINRIIGEGEILGASSRSIISSHSHLIRSLSFVSFSYSILIIASIIIKIRLALKKT